MIKMSLLCLLVSQLAFAQASSEVKIVAPAQAESSTLNIPASGTSTTAVTSRNKNNEPFNISLFMIGGYSDQQFRNGDPSFDIFDSYIAFNYNINPDVRVSARPAFGYSTDGVNKYGDKVGDKIRIRDFSFAASIRNILEGTLPDVLALKFKPRLYLPTSDGSKDQGMIAAFQAETELKYYFSRYNTLKFYMKPRYYFQRNTVFIDNSNPKKPNSLKTTSLVDSEHGVELSLDISKQFAFKPTAAFEESWSNTSNVNTDYERAQFRKTNVFYGAGLEIKPTRDFSFTVGVRTTKNIIDTTKTEETSYSVLTDIDLF